jgi:DNA-binding NarL/FixJ family response regulator
MSMAMRKSVVIADDHRMFRQGLKYLLEADGFDVVGEAENGQEAIRLTRQHSPHIAVLDYSMPVLNGIDAAKEIQRQSPQTVMVLLTMYNDERYALEALKCAIRGFVLKHQAAADLINAIREVLQGSIYLSPGISAAVVKALMSNDGGPGDDLLTGRERQVLQLIAEGNTTKDIAGLLHLSVKTAESHRSRIMSKLDVHNVAGLVRYSIREGIIQA